MNYNCKICGWKKEQGSMYWSSADYEEVFKHEKTHGKLAKMFKRKKIND